ncbi:hypothetical protein WDZ92_39365 [Nostoc sp. NIES-2111]
MTKRILIAAISFGLLSLTGAFAASGKPEDKPKAEKPEKKEKPEKPEKAEKPEKVG